MKKQPLEILEEKKALVRDQIAYAEERLFFLNEEMGGLEKDIEELKSDAKREKILDNRPLSHIVDYLVQAHKDDINSGNSGEETRLLLEGIGGAGFVGWWEEEGQNKYHKKSCEQ